jgi:PII interaction protein X
LFFIVTIKVDRFTFEPMSRSDARLLIETRLRRLRNTAPEQHQELLEIYQRTFQ